ncbi:MAG: menaquinone biosynthesis decarboxylase [Syntrophaceae bacterium CG2_30_49_12]|nr:MAG: menaquinone biosynthesis decarboxylase [Syntrophaceae bacterium CG2_30_49_12]
MPEKKNYRNLTDFIRVLEAEGELVRIKAPVSSFLEITEITDRVGKSPSGGKALLFEQVDGSSFPVITNAFGSEKRIALALGVRNLDNLGRRVKEILEQSPPKTLMEKLQFLTRVLSWGRYLPKVVRMAHPPCQEVVRKGDQVDLRRLPVLHCWPGDGGPFITLPVVFTKSLTTGKRNAGMYRLQVFDKNTTGMHWHIHKDGSHYFNEYRKAGKRMEVAVAIGTDPAVTYAATAPLPRGIDEMILAGFIRSKPVEMVKGITVDMEVPAEAEIVLEGYILPEERRLEGPFGDHTGYYSLPDDYPVFHVTAITHRKNAVYSATVVGRPPMEDCYLAKATERIFLPLLQTTMPEIVDYVMPWEGVFHNITIVALDKEYPGHPRKLIHGLWGAGQMSFCKMIVVVDGAADLHDLKGLFAKILDTVDLKSDLVITEGILDVLDHAAPNPLFGGKIGIDATERIRGEVPRDTGSPHRNNGRLASAEEVINELRALDRGFLSCRQPFTSVAHPLVLLQVDKGTGKRGRFFTDLLFLAKTIPPQSITVLYDADIDISDSSLLLWRGFNNVDPRRDIAIRGNQAVIDATRKGPEDGHPRPWPEDIVMTEEIRERVTARREELGLIGTYFFAEESIDK